MGDFTSKETMKQKKAFGFIQKNCRGKKSVQNFWNIKQGRILQ